jgi:hypothetical protein
MNNIETEERGTQSLVKIIRANSIGSNVWNSNGTNDWTTSTLQANLNSGEWWANNLVDYDDLLETVTWNLGGTNATALVASSVYNLERGTTVYSDHEKTWSGKIGLMYPSDYGFATSGGSTTDRTTCLATALSKWGGTDVSDCTNNDYLYSSKNEWTLTPYSDSSVRMFYVDSTGFINNGFSVSRSFAARPVGFLRSSTVILSGDGTSESPWIISV